MHHFLVSLAFYVCSIPVCITAQSATVEKQDAVVPVVHSQSYETNKTQALKLYEQDKHKEACSMFEDLYKQDANDAKVLEYMGSCLVHQTTDVTDETKLKQMRLQA